MSIKNPLELSDAPGKLSVAVTEAAVLVEVHPTAGQQAWRSPLLEVEIIDRMQERVTCGGQWRVMHADFDDQGGIHIVVRNAFHGVTIGVWLEWRDGELCVLVPPTEVEEAKDTLFLVHSIMVLPELMRTGADGTLLLPINTGMLCRPVNKPKLRDRFLIYGEQERWELLPTLPVSAAQTTKGGIVCLASQGATDAWCAVETDGAGHGTVAMGAMLRRQWIDPVDWTQREFRYLFLDAETDVVHAAAKRVRRHAIEDFGKACLAARAAESPQCAYQQSAYTMKMFHGIQQQGIMMFGREGSHDDLFYKRVLTFKQAKACMTKLKAAGVDNIFLESVGWNPRGHDGAWPTCFPIDRRLGGESGLRTMVDTAKALGYQITTHLNCASAFFKSPDFVPDHVIHDIWGKPKVVGFWGGGVKSTHWGLALPEGLLETRMKALKSFGFNAMQYLDGIGNPLYVNYHPVNGGPRRDHAAGINRYLDTARRIFGAVGTECGFFYCATHADSLCAPFYTPFNPWPINNRDWPIVELLDEPVPMWRLAMHGLVTHEQQGVGWRDAMNAVLMGAMMRDEWSAEPGVMPVLDDQRIAQIKAIYDLVTVRHGRLLTQEIVDWRRLAPQVEQTRFADGTEVMADFNDQRLTVNGKSIERPNVL